MTSAGEKPAKAFSCIRCFERKVKCDKSNPCSNCIKSSVACIFRLPPAPRRRKKRPQEEVLLARLKKCEELLKSKGIDIDGSPITPGHSTNASSEATQSQVLIPTTQVVGNDTDMLIPVGMNRQTGQLIVDQGKSRFIENNLWASVSEEFRQPNEAIAEYSEDEDDDQVGTPVEENTDFLLGYTPSNTQIQQLHPSPENLFVLWQLFLENINPMTKFVHEPSLHKTLVQASANLDNLPRGLEALMFAIYCSAVCSTEEDECEMKLGEPRKVLLARYRYGTRKALARARFMGASELIVLQAFVLYLLTMREAYDARTTWTLAGVAGRVAQGMGLHRDGTKLGVPPFETELRRRLWWQIAIMDFRSAELSGSGKFGDVNMFDTQLPTNVNDADIYPGMTEPAVPQPRPTEMIACLLRCEFGSFWKEKLLQKSKSTFENLRISSHQSGSIEERDANITELEQRLEEKFLRYCDPSIPIQFLAILVGRAAVNSMRLMAHHPRNYKNPEDVPASERKLLWELSIKLLESDTIAHSSRGLQRFMWHINVYFQWQALVYILNELKDHTLGDEVDRAWQQVDEVFLHHPDFVTDYKKPLHVAASSLALKAYNAREQALRASTNGVFPKVIPDYIRLLREQRASGAFQTSSAAKIERRESADKVVDDQFTLLKWDPSVFSGPGQQFTDQAVGAQLPVPTFQPRPVPSPSGEGFLFASEPTLAHDLAMSDMPMDWAQWDYIMQDFGQMPR